FSRSNGVRWPSFLTTVNSRSWTRSKVVKRAPQVAQARRRRIAVLSSVGRLSFTCVSSLLQNGQRIPIAPCYSANPVVGPADPKGPDRWGTPCRAPSPLRGPVPRQRRYPRDLRPVRQALRRSGRRLS